MQDFRQIGYRIKKYAKEKNVSDSTLSSIIGCSESKMESIYSGRFYLAFPQLEEIAKKLKVDTMSLLSGNEEEYSKTVVHCMNDFSDPNNRERVLDIIDEYLDVVDAIESA